MSSVIKAVLIKPVSFTDFDGIARTLPAGQVIEIMQLKTPYISTSVKGESSSEVVGSFIGSFGGDSFDIEPDEFKTID